MPFSEGITPNIQPDDYIPVDPSDLKPVASTDVSSPGVDIANNLLPPPFELDGVITATTHIDGFDHLSLLDPSSKFAVSEKTREFTEQGVVGQRRSDDPFSIVIVAALKDVTGWSRPTRRRGGSWGAHRDLDIFLFQQKPELSWDAEKGLWVVRRGAQEISRNLEVFFPTQREHINIMRTGEDGVALDALVRRAQSAKQKEVDSERAATDAKKAKRTKDSRAATTSVDVDAPSETK